MSKMNRILIAGVGTMGRGLAELFLPQGAHVALYHPDLDKVLAACATVTARVEAKGGNTLGLWKVWGPLPDLSMYDVIIEAVPESYPIKTKLLDEISQQCSGNTLLASCTSSLSITRLAEAVPNRADRFLGIHFFNPPNKMRLVEVVPGLNTGKWAVDQACEFARQFGREPIVINDSPGFAVNRILMVAINEAIGLVESQVATAEDVDRCMKLGCNHPMGPLELADFIGLDVCFAILDSIAIETGNAQYRPRKLLRRMIAAGNLGKKSGRGFLRYDQPTGDKSWAYNRSLFCNHD